MKPVKVINDHNGLHYELDGNRLVHGETLNIIEDTEIKTVVIKIDLYHYTTWYSGHYTSAHKEKPYYEVDNYFHPQARVYLRPGQFAERIKKP